MHEDSCPRLKRVPPNSLGLKAAGGTAVTYSVWFVWVDKGDFGCLMFHSIGVTTWL